MIDLNGSAPGGYVSWWIIAWIGSGLVGMLLRIYLLGKYREDLRVSRALGSSQARLRVSIQSIRNTWIHLVVKSIIVIMGLEFGFREFNLPAARGPDLGVAIGLSLIPWVLNLEALLEFEHQRWMMQHAPPWRDAGRLVGSTGRGG